VIKKFNSNDKKTIIFLTPYPFNEDFAKKYGFNYLKSKKYELIIINALGILYPHAVNQLPGYLSTDLVSGIEQKIAINKEKLAEILLTINGKRFVFLNCAPHSAIVDILKDNDIDYILVKNHTLFPIEKLSVIENIKMLILKKNFLNKVAKRFLRGVTLIVKQDIKKYHPPKFILSRSSNINIDVKRTKIIHVNSFDYDRVLEQSNYNKPQHIPRGKYYVLMVNHPWKIHDVVLSNSGEYIDRYEYKEIINEFLDLLEEKTNIKVVIAAYPKATKDENIYNGRPFLYDTEQLIKYSAGVIGHHTGAINFAVIHDKPICLIGLSYFSSYSEFNRTNKAFSVELGVPLHMIGSEKESMKLLKSDIFYSDKDKYNEYMKKYILSNYQSDKRIWEAVSEALEG